MEINHESLFGFQIEGAKWLATRRFALLADEMGLGKTAQAVVGADLILAKRVLVFCPAVARFNWISEFEQFQNPSPENPARAFDCVTSKRFIPDSNRSIVCSYDLAHHFDAKLFGDFDLLILDEAHYLKTPNTNRTRAILGKKGFIRHAKRTWALSGTPAPNNASELWPLLFTFGATKKSLDEFIDVYCTTRTQHFGYRAHKIITGTNTKTTGELKRELSTVMLRRKQIDVMKELPPIHTSHMEVEAGKVDLEASSSLVQWVFPENRLREFNEKVKFEQKIVEHVFDTDRSCGQYGVDLMKHLEAVARSVSTLRRYTGLQKVDPIAELITGELEIGAYDKIVIFAVHRDVINALRLKLQGFGAVTLYGGTDIDRRQENLRKFEKNPKCQVFIGNIQAAGTAITLTSANQVLFAELDWVPGNNAQAAKRCHRIGQEKPVFVRTVLLKDSYDARISRLLTTKTKQLLNLFDEKPCQEFKTYSIDVE